MLQDESQRLLHRALLGEAVENLEGAAVFWIGIRQDRKLARFFALFLELWRAAPFPVPDAGDIDPALRDQLASYRDALGADMPIGAMLTFLRCWTLKEAFVKATGDGLSIPLNSFEISTDPDSPPRLLHLSHGSTADWSLHSFEPQPGYLAAAAISGPANAWVRLSWSGPLRSRSAALTFP